MFGCGTALARPTKNVITRSATPIIAAESFHIFTFVA